MSSKHYQFKSKNLSEDMSNLDIKCLLEKGNTLFSMLILSEEAKKYLEYNPDLMEAIEKW